MGTAIIEDGPGVLAEPDKQPAYVHPDQLAAQTVLYAKLAEVMGAVDRIPKDGFNEHFNYHYATEAAIAEALRTELASRKVAMLLSSEIVQVRPWTRDSGSKTNLTDVQVRATFACGDTGATVTVSGAGTGEDSSDKGTYKGITGAVKYLLMKTFLIPTGDDPENTSSGGGSGGGRGGGGGSASRGGKEPVWPFGNEKGKPLSEVSDKSFTWALKHRFDVDDPKWGDANRKMREAIAAEQDRRAGGGAAAPAKTEPGADDDIPF